MPPETRYAKSGGVHIAYQAFGDGPINLAVAPIATASITLRKAGGSTALEHIKMNMTHVFVSSLGWEGETEDHMAKELVSLNFAKVELNYRPQNPGGSGTQ